MARVVINHEPEKSYHYTVKDLSAHKPEEVRSWLAQGCFECERMLGTAEGERIGETFLFITLSSQKRSFPNISIRILPDITTNHRRGFIFQVTYIMNKSTTGYRHREDYPGGPEPHPYQFKDRYDLTKCAMALMGYDYM